jgi:hypothetical protein
MFFSAARLRLLFTGGRNLLQKSFLGKDFFVTEISFYRRRNLSRQNLSLLRRSQPSNAEASLTN